MTGGKKFKRSYAELKGELKLYDRYPRYLLGNSVEFCIASVRGQTKYFLLVVYESNVTDEGCFEAIIFTTYTRYYNVYESDE